VATTRPETMLGDTAVAIHPEDQRRVTKPSSSNT
jgi:valyl-tRNA synthetase